MRLYDVKNLCFRYPSGTSNVLNDVNLALDEGEILSILGANGAGKSTLLDCMANLQVATSGVIRLLEQDISKLKPNQISRLVSYVPQIHVPAFGYTVLDFVIMGRAPQIRMFQKPSREDVNVGHAVLEELGISHLAEKPYNQISGGERQQASIARAVCQEPKVILFDEPTAHLDYGNQYRILQLIRQLAARGHSIIITTHNPDHALLLGGRVSILNRNGTLINGSSDEITEDSLRELYRIDIKLVHVPEIEREVCITPKLEDI